MSKLTTPDVGNRIRELRKQQGMSLRTLGSLCNLSINAISRIERGENSPTVSSLHRLATAFDVPITVLFNEEALETAITVKKDEGLRQQVEGILMESLGSGLPHQQIEPFLITIEPGTTHEENPLTHYGEEFVYCLEGSFEYFVGDRVFVMQAGDSLIFKATQPHYLKNPLDILARVILVFQSSQAQHLLHQHIPAMDHDRNRMMQGFGKRD